VDQLEKITSTKLTQNQKRGLRPGAHSGREFMNDRRNMDPVRPRPDAELALAQLRLAELALTKDDPSAWLSDVLGALGLHRVISAA
jgi:hypothetical protein